MFDLKKMLAKAAKISASAAVITGGVSAVAIPEAGIGTQATLTAFITVATFIYTSFMNWRKHK